MHAYTVAFVGRVPGRAPARLLALALGGLAAAPLGAQAGAAALPPGPDTAWWAPGERVRPPVYDGVVRRSLYVRVRDGTRLAVDVYLPRQLAPGTRLPALFEQTRYYRSFEPRAGLPPAARAAVEAPPERVTAFVTRGYAYVILDVRGTGASFGSRPFDLAPAEVRDGADVVDWIIRQRWSDGQVGATGTSYVGTTAELLLSTGHPAVRAAAPLFASYDAYPDVIVPGGVQMTWFARTWTRANALHDRNAVFDDAATDGEARRLIAGVRPVDGDSSHALLDSALAEHRANGDVAAALSSIEFRDDAFAGGFTLDSVSPAARRAARARGVPVYGYSGWWDGGYAHAAVARFRTLGAPGSRLVLGPWMHGGAFYHSPDAGARRTGFDHVGEQLRFFDRYLKGTATGVDPEPPVHYYTMGEERWHAARSFPPPEARSQAWYFHPAHALAPEAPAASERGEDRYLVDTTAATGPTSRWNPLAGGPLVRYPDRRAEDAKLLTYTSAPLEAPLTVTGYPVVTLAVRSTAPDGQFFVYLEAVDSAGAVHYVTEGQLRAVDRAVATTAPYDTPVEYRTFCRRDARPLVPGQTAELRFHLLPTSYRFPRGSRVRVAIAGADRDHFAPAPGVPPTIAVLHGGESSIALPVVPAIVPGAEP